MDIAEALSDLNPPALSDTGKFIVYGVLIKVCPSLQERFPTLCGEKVIPSFGFATSC